MRFTLQQIKDTHAKVKSGADFPQYVQDLKQLGMKAYTVHVNDGSTEYTDVDNANVSSDAKYDTMNIHTSVNKTQFVERLQLHQRGGTDYMTFCKDCAENGIAGWTMDFTQMTCAYFDLHHQEVLIEQIPSL